MAQKTLQEGIIIYHVSISDPASKTNAPEVTGTYIIYMKGNEMRKQLEMSNGYNDILIFANSMHNLYSLKAVGNKKYAIQLSADEFVNQHERYKKYTFTSVDEDSKSIAGMQAKKAMIGYADGANSEIWYTTDISWQPTNEWVFERMPGIHYLPLAFVYKETGGMSMSFRLEKADSQPIENSMFKIPADYKIISYKEFLEMSKK